MEDNWIDPNLMKFAVGTAESVEGRKTAEQRCYSIIQKAMERGYQAHLGNSDKEVFNTVSFWWGHRSFFDHDFAKAYFGEFWLHNLEVLISIDSDYAKLEELEKYL